jgi:acetylornithine deacetylase/succinyl-diaminopimelate desuccinylase-like protein
MFSFGEHPRISGPSSAALSSPILGDFLSAEREAVLDALASWVRIPSVGAQPVHDRDVATSAEWCAERMTAAGLEHVEILPTAGHPTVYGDWLHADAAVTALVYGHHDVQPADPLDEWESPPFVPTLRSGRMIGRGASDDKGQVLCHLEAIRGLLGGHGPGALPVNVKVLVEGEEEIGSPHFQALLEAERERLACDVIVVSDTQMWAAHAPSISTGMRGLVAFDVHLRTAGRDLHSGVFGGAVPNAAHWASRLVAALHDRSGRVALPGFYDAVRPLGPAERAAFAALPLDEAEWAAAASVGCLEGEAGVPLLERLWARPTCDVTGLHSGYGGEGLKTIVPAAARLKVTFRLVPDQSPAEVVAAFEAWARRLIPAGVDLEIHRDAAIAPALTPTDHPAVAALARSITRVWGAEPLYTRSGGSGPEEGLGRILAAPVLHLGIGLTSDRIHAPNEGVDLDQVGRGVLAAGELWRELAALS